MKKVTVLGRADWQEEILVALRDLGIVHLQMQTLERPGQLAEESDVLELRQNIALLERTLALMPPTSTEPEGAVTGLDSARRFLEICEQQESLARELRDLTAQYDGLRAWGRFSPNQLRYLQQRGVVIRFYLGREKELAGLPPGLCLQKLGRQGKTLLLGVVWPTPEQMTDLPLQEVYPPARGRAEVEARLAGKRQRLVAVERELAKLRQSRPAIVRALQEQQDLLVLATAKGAVTMEKGLVTLTGYCPSSEVARVRNTAHRQRWGLLVEEPGATDPVPTLMRYSAWSRIWQPIMDFVGVIPGYREVDGTGPSLFFFAIFVALLIGDAGYGLLLLLAALLFLGRSAPNRVPFFLLAILAATTMLWGALTGSWFGVLALEQTAFLRRFTIPALAVASPGSGATVIHLCFLLGAVQLSLAHLWRAFGKFPGLAAIADVGWALVIWAFYCVALRVVLNLPMNPLAATLLAVGTALVLLFDGQKNSFSLEALGQSLTRSPLTLLTGMGSLADLISYIRLFAVGIATREVALAVNTLALEQGFATTIATFTALAILFAGHGLNLLLGAMAVLVHGVRLNLLEFSRHLDVNWSGIPYVPFKKRREPWNL